MFNATVTPLQCLINSHCLVNWTNSVIGLLVKVYLWTAGMNLVAIGVVTLLLVVPGSVRKFEYQLKFVLLNLSVFGTGIILWPLYMIQPHNPINFHYANNFIQLTTKVLHINTTFRNTKHLENDHGGIICMNHQSSLDAILFYKLSPIGRKVAPVAKKELFYVVPFGFCSWLAGVKFVDRSTPAAAYRTLNDCAQKMAKDNIKYVIFPEGTRNKNRSLLKFKRGAFKTAINGQVPIIPIVVSPYYFVDHEKRKFDSGNLIIKALAPIPTKGMTDADHEALMDKTWKLMEAEYQRLGNEIDGLIKVKKVL